MPRQLYYLIIISISVLAIQFGVYKKVQKHTLKNMPEQRFQSTLYVSSPIEEFILESSEQIWPRTFNEQFLLEARWIPKFYELTRSLRNQISLRQSEIFDAKRWSVLVNTKHYASLRADLFGRDTLFKPKSFDQALTIIPGLKQYENCHLYLQERAFRIAQLIPAYIPQAKEYFNKCRKQDSLPVLWLSIYPLLIEKSEKLNEFKSKLKQISLNPEFKYKRVQAANMLKVIELAVSH